MRPPTSKDLVPSRWIGALKVAVAGSWRTGVGATRSPTTTNCCASGELALPESSTTISDAVYVPPTGRPGASNTGVLVTTGARPATVHRYSTTEPPMSNDLNAVRWIGAPAAVVADGASSTAVGAIVSLTTSCL